jgi:hypothetical protein
VYFSTRKRVVHLPVSFSPFSNQLFPMFFQSFEWLVFYCLRSMLRQYSREELMSFNRPAPPSITHSRFVRLRHFDLCLFRPTKRPKKRRHRTDQKQHQSSQTAKLCLLNARSIMKKDLGAKRTRLRRPTRHSRHHKKLGSHQQMEITILQHAVHQVSRPFTNLERPEGEDKQ